MIERPKPCEHPISEIRRRVLTNGTTQYWRQCQDCGGTVGTALKTAVALEEFTRQIDITGGSFTEMPTWDTALEEHGRFENSRRWREWSEQNFADMRAAQARQDAAWWDRYNAYLRSDAWAHKRQQVLERDQYICQGCRRRRATQVHHLTYKNVCNEFLFELVAVCDHCHERLHQDHDI